ncbi:MAG: IS3 family transposase [Bifidobacterium adolescentis]
MRDTGRSPLHLLLDDRASWTERADPIAGDVRAVRRDGRERYGARKIKAALERRGVTASRRRIGNIMREQGMTARTRADGPNRTGRGPTRPGSRTCRPRGSDGRPARIWRAILPMSASAETGRTCVCWSTWRTGASSAIPPGGPGTRAWYWARSPRSTSR